jgi:peroxiredoxin
VTEDAATGTLKSRLAALCASRAEVSAWNAAYEETISELSRAGFLQNVIKEGDPFPDFVLPSAEGRLISLASLLERGPVIISFFRGEWCPFCQVMLAGLAEALPQIEAAGASLLALTPETGSFPLAIKQRNNARFEVLSDVDCGVGLAAGLIFRMPKLYRARMESAGVNLSKHYGNASWFVPVPATFIVTPDSLIAWRFLDADFTHRAEPSDIIDALHALRPGKN